MDAHVLAPDARDAVLAELTPAVRDEVLELLHEHDAADDDDDALFSSSWVNVDVGPYTLLAPLGAGGAGQVFRAVDNRLDRQVAVKLLTPCHMGPNELGRFEREARAVAALSHPNVLAIFDVGRHEGAPYLVTELLQGSTLRQRLRLGQMPLSEVLHVALQLLDGLAAAHRRGLVHRDLKPENVFLQDDGAVKLLDFGLARAPRDAHLKWTGNAHDDDAITTPGLFVGTPGYAAPEQARGHDVGPAADLFAFGVVLYEMLTGRRAFAGDSPVDVLQASMTDEPVAIQMLNPDVPDWLVALCRRCMAKDQASRFHSAVDLAHSISDAALAQRERMSTSKPWRSTPGVLAAVVALTVVAVAGYSAGRNAAPPVVTSSPVAPPRPQTLSFSGRDGAPAVSKDGKFLAVASDRDDRSRIWISHLNDGGMVPLTDGPDGSPRFFPGGGHLLFVRTRASGKTSLHRVPLLGGEPRLVIDDAADADVSPDGTQIAFVRWVDEAQQAKPVLMLADVDGANPRALAPLPHRTRATPRFSPSGDWIAVTGLAQQPGAPQAVRLFPVAGGQPVVLPTPETLGLVSAVAWESDDVIVYSQALSVVGNSAGSPSRLVRQEVHTGEHKTILFRSESSLVVDVWPNHGVVFDSRSAIQNLREVHLGTGASRTLSTGTASDRQPVYAPDGREIVFSSLRGNGVDLWSIDRASGVIRRKTTHSADDWDPAFSVDGTHLLFSSYRGGNFEIWRAERDGASPEQVSHDGVDAENPTETPDGWVVYASGSSQKGIWKVRTDGTDATFLVPGAILPEVSPDGKYVLYQTNRTPRLAVVGVAEVSTGRVLPFALHIDVKRPTPAILGRARWWPDGRGIAFVGQDEHGASGVYLTPFHPDEPARGPWTKLGGFDPERTTESFGISHDGLHMVLAEWQQRSAVVAVTEAH